MMTGEIADISPLVEFDFYEWCMYLPNTKQFPEDNWTLGKYILPSTRVGPVMTAKILTQAGNYTYSLDYRPLSEDEWKDEEIIRMTKFVGVCLQDKMNSSLRSRSMERCSPLKAHSIAMS
mmetsp:Transcript_19218/g.46392  ORF Transcript_19218/g.46392 Transcript_19218/m.46392 type:complete len:120 (+) Transcript_19218:335-694(+)